LDQELVEEYAELTYFNKYEIKKLFKKFQSLDSKRITPENFNSVRVRGRRLSNLPELQQNPFLHRLVTVFATSDEEGEKLRVCEGDDGSEDGALDLNWKAVSFEDFMDMMNALCDKSPFELKAHYAFKVFDFDGDDFIGPEDIEAIIKRTACNGKFSLDKEELAHLTKAILDEADLDKDDKLGESEFEHMLKKSPDFLDSFQVRIL